MEKSSATLYEAESVTNTHYDTRIFKKTQCSNGMCVGWIGYDRYLQFNDVYVSKSDTYGLQISYLVSGERDLFFCINGKYYFKKTLGGSSFDKPATVMIDVPLTAGNNTIRFYNNDAWAPDIDFIKVCNIYMRTIYI